MISIIIPTCKKENLIPCLESIFKYTDMSDKECIVVANGYDGDINEIKGCNVISYPERIGYTKAVNRGIQAAISEYIVLLNDDTILLPQEIDTWITMLTEPFKNEKVGITGPLKSWCPHAERNFLVFFCVAMRKKLFDELSLLDSPTFSPGGGEDTDFCIKAENADYELMQVPNNYLEQDKHFMVGNFPIYHAGERTVSELPNWKEIFDRNSKILAERYKLPSGWFYPEDIKVYRKLVSEMPDEGILVELGVWQGRSLCSVADIIKKKNIKVYAVDTFEGTENEGDAHKEAKEIDLKQEFEKNLERFGIKATIFKMTTDEAAKHIPEASLLFIDADHSYEAVKKDIQNYSAKVKAGHDYSWEGVKKAVHELLENVEVHHDSLWHTY